jgi:hypothetical protein
MDWQTAGALAVVLVAAVVLTRWKIRSLQKDLTTPCTGSCSCGSRPGAKRAALSLEKTPPTSYLDSTDNQEYLP